MQTSSTQPITSLWQGFAEYLPTLLGGLLVVALGLALGWLAKRTLVRVLLWLRLDRLAGRVGWRAAFAKGDVRAALYNALGSVLMFVIVLIFVDDAMQRLGLTVLSRVLDGVVFYLPNLAVVGLIVGLGVLVSNGLAASVTAAFEEEGIAHARLFGKAIKGALIAVVVALALWQLEFARQIVLAAFLISFGAIGVAFALGVGLGSARAIQASLERVLERNRKE
jgi:Mechanosensitive ion channel, conserved TM helix